jgi:hypothetical protein
MGFDDVFDLEAVGVGFLDVDLDVASRVNDCGLAFRPDEVRRVRQACQIELLEVHRVERILAADYADYTDSFG